MSKRKRYMRHRRRIVIIKLIILSVIIVLMMCFVGYIGVLIKGSFFDDTTSKSEETDSVNNVTSQIEEIPQEESSVAPTKDINSIVEAPSQALTEQEKKQYVLEHPEEYTVGLIDFMNKYDQVIDYVYNYKDRENISSPVGNVDDATETDFPLFIQWDARWGYEEYGDSIIGIAGCGPTTLAMVYEGITGEQDQTPVTIGNMSERNGYCVSGGGTSWELMTKGANELGIKSQEIPLYEGKLIEELENGHPIICNVGPGDFTQGGHFIVVTGYKEGKFMVNDPNSRENSSKLWEYSVLESQIKNLWSFWK